MNIGIFKFMASRADGVQVIQYDKIRKIFGYQNFSTDGDPFAKILVIYSRRLKSWRENEHFIK